MKRLPIALLVLLLGGCYAEGESSFIGTGETKRFLSLRGCEREATSKYTPTSPVYSAFECREMLAGFVVSVRRYSSGARSDTATGKGDSYRLMRSSATDSEARYHVATFDASRDYGAAYNFENCMRARALFAAQPGVVVTYFCEPI